MGKTYAHIRDPKARAAIAERQQRQRIMATMINFGTGGMTQEFDDLTLADLVGLDHIASASKEG